ncbi:MAG: glycosyltransferase family 2 protein [Syntrophaceae bacterium]|nr:glycosyltransferase family 2 protein [Syntrophaceae bacterium]
MIAAIVVSYNPEADIFVNLLHRLINQVDRLFIVDNSPVQYGDAFDFLVDAGFDWERVVLIRMGNNLGIAAALNVGIVRALQEGADFVLLSDHDSLPDENMVPQLLAAYETMVKCGVNVGAVGPTFTELQTKRTHPFHAQMPGRFFYGKNYPTHETPHVEALTLITSGTLIPAHVLRDVGMMCEDLFIDLVDFEWCHRVRRQGYHLFGTIWAMMYHRMGDGRLRLWYLYWRYANSYSPLRIYYQVRNFIALCKLDYIDWRWKVRFGWYCLGVVYSHSIFSSQRLESLEMTAMGVWHGLIGKMGRYPE